MAIEKGLSLLKLSWKSGRVEVEEGITTLTELN
jgi:hypothetical protein